MNLQPGKVDTAIHSNNHYIIIFNTCIAAGDPIINREEFDSINRFNPDSYLCEGTTNFVGSGLPFPAALTIEGKSCMFVILSHV
jgi:hypothetical protein